MAAVVVPSSSVSATPVVVSAAGTTTLAFPPRIVSAHDMACTSPLHCVLAADTSGVTNDGGATWTTPTLSFGVRTLKTVECPSSTVCLGFDATGAPVRTADGGATWTVVSSSGLTAPVSALHCASVTHCVAVGSGPPTSQPSLQTSFIWTTDDGGTTWVQRLSQPPSNGEVLRQVSCASTTFCVATDGRSVVLQSTDGGVQWAASSVSGQPILGGLSCVAPATCVLLMVIPPLSSFFVVTQNSGTTWSSGLSLVGFQPRSVSCNSATSCVAGVGLANDVNNGEAITFDPRAPGPTASVLPAGVRGVDFLQCIANTTDCVGVGGANTTDLALGRQLVSRLIIHSTDGGQSWTRGSAGSGTPVLRDVACGDATHCLAVGDIDQLDPTPKIVPLLKRSSDGGTTWVDAAGPADLTGTSLNSTHVTCPSVSLCVMSGVLVSDLTTPGMAVSNDSGATWTLATVPSSFVADSFGHPTCFGSDCYIAARQVIAAPSSSDFPLVVLHSTDGALTWTVVRTVAAAFGAIGCVDGTHCLLSITSAATFTAARVERTVDGGATWQSVTVPLARQFAGPARCISLGCLLTFSDFGVDDVRFTTDLGLTWSVPPPFLNLDPTGTPTCFGTNCILAVSGNVWVSTDGQTWQPQASVVPFGTSLVCVSATLCVSLTHSSASEGTALGRVTFTYSAVPAVAGLVPVRLLETRVGPEFTTTDHQFEGLGELAAGSTLVLQVAGRGGVPADATSAMLNVTVTEPAAGGFVTVYPCGSARPVASSLNFVKGLTVANNVLAKFGPGGTVCIYTRAATHVLVDVNAFVPPGSASVFGVPPARLLETRRGPGLVTVDHLFQGVGKAGTGSVIALQVAGRGGVPVGAAGAVLNVTVTEPSDGGFVTAYPCDQVRPVASNVNYVTGQTVPNGVYAKLDSAGRVCLFTSSPTHLAVDVNAYIPGVGSFLNALVPARLLETRTGPDLGTVDGLFDGLGMVGARVPLSLQVAGRGGVPVGASTAMLNVTVTESTDGGFVTVYPCDQPVPLASNVNFDAGATVANAVVAKLAANGTVCVYSSAPTQVLVDVNAYIP